MATLVLAAAGSALGTSLGGSVLGVSSAVLLQATGALVGQAIDAKLRGGLPSVNRSGPRLEGLDVMTSQEGGALPSVEGRTAIAGEVIWAAKIKETVERDRDRVGSGKQKQTVTTTNYSYSASFAVSLGEGPLVHLGRVWADNRPLDLSKMLRDGRVRFYHGTDTQNPDPLIEAIEGAAPAFRGTAYVVFEDLPLEDYGNRVPQIKCEVYGQSGDLEPLVRGVNVIPGTTENGYNPEVVRKVERNGSGSVTKSEPDNAARFSKVSDWSLSMDTLGAVLPNADTVSLVVAYFGTDLRAGRCDIVPRVEDKEKDSVPAWSAKGLTRDTADRVSLVDGVPSYGSAPSDASVIAAIRDLKARGKRVVLYPFIMMDLQASDGLPNPDGIGTQPDFPWRGRIEPETGNTVQSEIDAFCNGSNGFDSFINHLADLAATAGGVDAFLIGSELRGLTMATDTPGVYPFVTRLKSLAASVKSTLPGALVSYAADWSEYHSHQTGGGVYFHLDPLWSDANVDFVGIDNYLPLSDWRDGAAHLDYSDADGITSIYNLDYLKSNIEGGEYWDFYYASDADRVAQTRTPIADLAHGEDWIFRQKAIRDWRANAHHNRPGGVRDGSPTGWAANSKPVWFTELGSPAVDKGANQPNVFVSRLSSESSVPHFSAGTRDDYGQRQFLRAWLEWLADNTGSADPANVQVWAWDARPWPEFPQRTSLWADGPDWELGHWLNGRAGAAPAAEAIRRRLARHGFTADLDHAHGQADGYAAPAPLGFRDWFQPFEIGLGLQASEVDGALVFETRPHAITAAPVTADDLVDNAEGWTLTRSALEDVARGALFTFRNGVGDYDVALSRAVIGAGPEDGLAQAESPLVLDFDRGSVAVERLLRAAADARETIILTLPRSARDTLRVGNILPVDLGEGARLFMVDAIHDGAALEVHATAFSAGAWAPSRGASWPARGGSVAPSNAVLLRFLDLPLIPGRVAEDWDGYAAAHAAPWPGSVALARSEDQAAGYGDAVALDAPAILGETVADLAAGPSHRWTDGPLDVVLYSGDLVGRPAADVLAGDNMLAIRHTNGVELVQFRDAELIAARTYRLTGLLRGQWGTDKVVDGVLAAGADVTVLDRTVAALGLTSAQAGRTLWWRYGDSRADVADHATEAAAIPATGLRPYAPAHFTATPSAGDVVLGWTRRSRAPVETFTDTPADPPVFETSEAYRVQIGPAGSPVRSVDVTAPGWTYTAAMIAADGIAAPYRVAVAQISETYGPGSWAETNLEA